MTTTQTLPRFRVVGMTDDGACECCGRTDLKRRVVLVRLSSGERVMFGTDCAARALQTSSKAVKREATEAQFLADQEVVRQKKFADRVAMCRARFERDFGSLPK